MSTMSKNLDRSKLGKGPRPGPVAMCYYPYMSCDEEDLELVHQLKSEGNTWEQIQNAVDSALGIPEEDRIPVRSFTYHWVQNCKCWRDR